ncbi:hypothetical protein [Fusobacterium sp. PH5-44]|uniref:hypothetical protein n=1 Tax=unclassified Fusobacterium TaxID=2648384 RepID=UPI003D25735E
MFTLFFTCGSFFIILFVIAIITPENDTLLAIQEENYNLQKNILYNLTFCKKIILDKKHYHHKNYKFSFIKNSNNDFCLSPWMIKKNFIDLLSPNIMDALYRNFIYGLKISYYSNGCHRLKILFSKNYISDIKVFFEDQTIMYNYSRNSLGDISLACYSHNGNLLDYFSCSYFDFPDITSLVDFCYFIPTDFIIFHYLLNTNDLNNHIKMTNDSIFKS